MELVSMNIKDITMPLIIHYYLLSIQEHYTNLSTLNHNVRFLPCQHPGRWHNAIRVRAKPCVHRFNYSRTLPQVPVRAVDIVNPGIRRFIAPDIH